jgi:hypothetical protein
MKKYSLFLSVSILLTVLISTQSSLGGKLESFIGEGEFVTAMCGIDDTDGDLLNFELDTNERVQINCGADQFAGSNVDMNVTLKEGDSIKVTCSPPAVSGDVVIPIPLNNIQKVLCTTTATTD